MRQQVINVYQFNELSDSAKENAINWYRNAGEYAWTEEWIDSLYAFADAIDITIDDYSVSPYAYSEVHWSHAVSYDFDPDDLDDMKGLRLRTWLINNYLPEFEKPKYIYGMKRNGKMEKVIGINSKHYYSKLQTEISCPFTGFVGDHSLIDPILKFINEPNDYESLDDIIDNCMSNFIKEWQKDMEYQDSDEYIIENIEANEYEFNDDGSIY